MSTDYMSFTEDGATITLHAQRVRLSWVALRQLCTVIAVAEKVLHRTQKEE